MTWLIRVGTSSGPVTHLMVGASQEAMLAELQRILEGITKWGTVDSWTIQEHGE